MSNKEFAQRLTVAVVGVSLILNPFIFGFGLPHVSALVSALGLFLVALAA